MAETPAIQRGEKDWTRARRIVADMWPALDYLARWELGNARRQALWPISHVAPEDVGWRVTIKGPAHQLDTIHMMLENDSQATWALEAPNGDWVPCTDMQWKAAHHGSPLWFLANADDMQEVGPGWNLLKVPVTFTKELMGKLAESIRTRSGNTSLMLQALAQEAEGDDAGGTEEWNGATDGLNPDQAVSVHHAMTEPVTLIWGPPGTGKTAVIGRILEACWRRGENVAILSHTNVAVDGPLVRLAERLEQTPEGHQALVSGDIQRWGSRFSPILQEARVHGTALKGYVLPDYRTAKRQHAERWGEVSRTAHALQDLPTKELRAQWQLWVDTKMTLHTMDQQPWVVPPTLTAKEAAWLDEEADRWTHDESLQLTDSMFPKVVGTTITSAFLSQWEWLPDVVIVDEVTMAILPALAFTALLAKKRVVFAGDFLQLPAIHPDLNQWPTESRAAATRWIDRDIFAAHGITPRHLASTPVLVALREQYRMHADICALVNQLAYAPALTLTTRADPLPAAWPNAEARLVLIDTQRLSVPAQSVSGSWANAGHQELIDAIVVQMMARDPAMLVGIVSPFRAQAQQLARRLAKYPGVLSATAHRFQGSERAVMILDPVRQGLGASHPFLGDTVSALRLWNVAISRAQRQVVMIAPATALGSVIPAQVARYIHQHGQTIDAYDLLSLTPVGAGSN